MLGIILFFDLHKQIMPVTLIRQVADYCWSNKFIGVIKNGHVLICFYECFIFIFIDLQIFFVDGLETMLVHS